MASVHNVGGKSPWRTRWRNPNGEEGSKCFELRRDANALKIKIEHEQQMGVYVDHSDRTLFGTFLRESYWPTMNRLAPTSRARDESYIRNHLLPRWEGWPLARIDYATCQGWIDSIDRSPATVHKIGQIMGKVMKMAVKARRIATNPMAEVDLPQPTRGEDVFLTADEVAELADAMGSVTPEYRALVFVGCWCGPRIGELISLRWSDVDFLQRTLSITRTTSEVRGHLIPGSPKTNAGRRTVPLLGPVARELERHRTLVPSRGLIFPSPNGDMIRVNNLRRRAWAEAVKRAGGKFERMTFHDMRHTAVSLWIAGGVSDLAIARSAGHTSVSFTKDRYGHLFPDHIDDMIDKMDAYHEASTNRQAADVVNLRRS